VAVGVGLFYLILQILKALYGFGAFLFSGLFSAPNRFRKQKDLRSKPAVKKPVTIDDDAPPFVFR
jgi:hypothetical protein